jgi:hypothetical protein
MVVLRIHLGYGQIWTFKPDYLGYLEISKIKFVMLCYYSTSK